MNEFIEELRLHIFLHYKTQTNYAKFMGVSISYISAIVRGERQPSKLILDDLGYKIQKIIVKK